MPKFAQRIYDMESSAKIIRALFGAMDSPNIISLGGGAPASDALPVEAVHDICTDVITRNKRRGGVTIWLRPRRIRPQKKRRRHSAQT